MFSAPFEWLIFQHVNLNSGWECNDTSSLRICSPKIREEIRSEAAVNALVNVRERRELDKDSRQTSFVLWANLKD